MVGLTYLIAAVALAQPQNTTLLSRIFPNPSGKNGYEEYVMAGDIVNGYGLYEQWLGYLQRKSPNTDPASDEDAPTMPAGVNPRMCDLEVRRIMDDRFGRALYMMSAGNQKQVRDPHEVVNLDTVFPELAPFKTIAKADTNRAHVEFSDGRTAAGVKDLLEGLKFSHNIFGTTRLSTLVSVATQAIILAEFERDLGQLSLDDAKEIDKASKALLDQPLRIADVIRKDYTSMIASLDGLLDKPDTLFDPGLGEQDKLPLFQNLSPTDREQIKSMVTQSLASRLTSEAARYDGPESGWLERDQSDDPTYSLNDHSVSNLAAIMSDALSGKAFKRNYSNAIAKDRIQLRLLRLHAQVIEYKWLHYHLPDTLKDCAYDHADFDPMTGDEFHYEKTDSGYRLYSKGVPGVGRIELKYRIQQSSGSASGPNLPPSHA